MELTERLYETHYKRKDDSNVHGKSNIALAVTLAAGLAVAAISYNHGRKSGFQEGSSAGYISGFKKGYKAGYEKAKPEGFVEGLRTVNEIIEQNMEEPPVYH